MIGAVRLGGLMSADGWRRPQELDELILGKAKTPSKGATWDEMRKALKDAGCALPRLCQ